MVKFILFIFSIMFLSNIYCQKAPGYLGKKTKAGYSVMISPSLGQPNASGNSGLLSFNFSHNISVERAVNRVRSFAISFEMFTTQTNMGISFAEEVYHPEFDGGVGGVDFITFVGKSNSTLNVKAFSLNSIKYSTGMAPFGVNFYWGVKFLMMEQNMSNTLFQGDPYSTFSSINSGVATREELIYETDDYYNYKTFGLNIGGEINRSIKDLVVITVGFQSTILPTYLSKVLFDSPGGTPRFETEFYQAHVTRMTVHQLFSMKIGIGILLP